MDKIPRYFILLGIFLSSCVSSLQVMEKHERFPENRDGHQYVVQIKIHDFEPAVISITVGEAVKWYVVDRGNHHHRVVSDTGLFDSGDLWPRDVFTLVFDAPGIYKYHDGALPLIKGEVRVSSSKTTTSGTNSGSPPDTTPTTVDTQGSQGSQSLPDTSETVDTHTDDNHNGGSNGEGNGLLPLVTPPELPMQSMQATHDGSTAKMAAIITLSLGSLILGMVGLFYFVKKKLMDENETEPLIPQKNLGTMYYATDL